MCVLMSVEQGTDTLGGSWVVHRTTSYMACERCDEGALVWDEAKQMSKCNSCGSVYEGKVDGAY